MKILSRKEAKKLNKRLYFTGKPCKNGHISERQTQCGNCLDCKEAWRLQNKDKCFHSYKQSRKRRIDKHNKYNKEWGIQNPDYYKLWSNTKRGRGIRKANQAKRIANKKHATPIWVDLKAIQEIYINCPKGLTVDHIVPLQGTNVCGLHVPWNLQYLTRSENSSKGNRLKNT